MVAAKSFLSTLGSVAAAAMVARSIYNDYFPYEVRDYLFSSLHTYFTRRLSSDMTMIIEEFDDGPNHFGTNEVFEAAELYIGACTSITSSSSTTPTRLKVHKPGPKKKILVNVDKKEEIVDEFQGIKFRWMLHCQHVKSRNYVNDRDMNATLRSEVRSFHLTFHKKYKNIVIGNYFPHILKEVEFLKEEINTVKLFSLDPEELEESPWCAWRSISLNHSATFETVAMDSRLKDMILEDLGMFVTRKDYYRRVGKAWKRGYLLYGPPGTGKSSLIAAMANYLKFNVYDLQLDGLKFDWELRSALLGTGNKSIVVVEDIDCSIQFNNRDDDTSDDDVNANTDTDTEADADGGPPVRYHKNKKVTLSGILNFIDGLWSSCGDERIIIFTTNHKDKLDSALLRPGRMDLHIHMSYCTPCGFKVLAKNYLDVSHHEIFLIVESLIEEAQVTPAEAAEQLMRHDEDDLALHALVEFLKLKIVENTKEKAKKLEDSSESEFGDSESKDN